MDTLTLNTQNQVYNLYTLLSAGESDLPKPAQALLIQADIDAGNARFFIGDLKMVTDRNRYGCQLLAGGSFGIDSVSSNLINLPQITIYCDTAGQKVSVMVITR